MLGRSKRMMRNGWWLMKFRNKLSELLNTNNIQGNTINAESAKIFRISAIDPPQEIVSCNQT